MRHLNLVFQGGGIRGVAYAGVLREMPGDIKVHGVGGSSAGALAAALLAVGKKSEELQAILSDPDLYSFLHPQDVERTDRLVSAMKSLCAFPFAPQGWWRLPALAAASWKSARLLNQIRADVLHVWQQRGLHNSSKLRQWLDDKFQGKTFADVERQKHVDDLRIVAADLTKQAYRIFDVHGDRSRPIAEAVHASVSIPIFFSPFSADGRLFVDGGLLSNFPSFLFAQSRYPTIGFRLQDVPPLQRGSLHAHQDQPPDVDTWRYLELLVRTMLEAHDKFRELPTNFHSYNVETPDDIGATQFALSGKDVSQLIVSGRLTGKSVEWQKHSSTKPIESVYDAKPAQALEMSMLAGQAVRDAYYLPSHFVDKLFHRTQQGFRIARRDVRGRVLRECRLNAEKPHQM